MKKFIQYIAVAALVLISISACKGFLDPMPTDSVVDKNAMVTMPDARVACNGLYTPLKYYGLYGTYFPYMGDLRADNIYPRTADGTGSVIYTWQYESSQNSYFGTFWESYYNVIMRCNSFIENINVLEVTSDSDKEEKNGLTGEAYAVRALCYFDLARLYGQPYTYDKGASLGAVILKERIFPTEAAEASRSTVADTYALVLSDLDSALAKLPESKKLGHFNYWAAKLLQARVFLYMGQWDKAYAAAEEVINSSPYELVDPDEYLSYWGEEGNDESVLELLVSVQGDIDEDGGFYTMYHNLWFDDANAGASLIPTLKWRSLFFDTPNDVRAEMIAYDDPETGAKGTGEFWLRKFIGNKDQGYTFRRNNPRVLRMSEAFLIAAEAGLEANKSEALAYFNEFCESRYYDYVDATTLTLDMIQTERQKEFIGEGHRFFDVMRRGGSFTSDKTIDPHDFRGGSQYQNSLKVGDAKVALPISSDEIATYPKLQQNPGYKN
ncbi:MAG: RagB/SusD family nutrient uptake outer membrane protein [Bacteroidales bacterium]|nr:RagB/SusD family nutrient uptake outer membrane protein [Candidatus Cacconaster equi]